MRWSAFVLAGLMVAGMQADTLLLRNGQRVEGTFVGGDRDTIRFQPQGSSTETSYRLREVDSLQIAGMDRRFSGRADRRGAAAARPSSDVALPAGTVVTVRTIDRIDSDAAKAGETYRASLDEPVVVNGQTLASAGADATIRVVRVEQSGTVRGSEEIALELDSIRGSNRTFTVRTSPAEVAAKSRGQQSAKVIGGTAAVGAIIGAIAGGGKGAAIGAASGAGAGTAIQAIRGQRIKIEPETRLDFTISEDVYR